MAKEQTAATAMLDETHPDLPNPLNDSNAYTLGSVSEHNVVIACLPIGKIGNTQAAAAASRMASTFPSIKFALMVGIGAGIPPEVRLSDVVVSSPVDQYSGVVQSDLGKKRQKEPFDWTGHVNAPPDIQTFVDSCNKINDGTCDEEISVPRPSERQTAKITTRVSVVRFA
jgi:nucleoside phosphorylase